MTGFNQGKWTKPYWTGQPGINAKLADTAELPRAKDASRANRGKDLEMAIILGNALYRQQGRAVVHKVPTEFIPIRNPQGKISSVKVEEKAAVDFMGTFKGHSINFDAKHTTEERIDLKRLEPHQAEFLEDCQRDGAISFILVAFSMREFYVVPWEVWKEAQERREAGRGMASIKRTDLPESYRIENRPLPYLPKHAGKMVYADYTRSGKLLYPDYLSAVERIFKL